MSWWTNVSRIWTTDGCALSGPAWYPLTDHKMGLNLRFAEPANAERSEKPLVDVSKPLNLISDDDNAHKWGISMGTWGTPVSFMHFSGWKEQIPYASTYSSWDCFRYCWVVGTAYFLQYLAAKIQQGNVFPLNPRTSWAHKIVFWGQFARFQLAYCFGAGGFFFGYEFMYTYVPYLRIRDPSPEGWKQCWQTGQTTYLARFFASMFPALAYVFYRGGTRKAPFWFGFTVMHSWWYEFCRPAFSGNKLFFGYRSTVYSQLQQRYGALVPDPERRNDPDTNMPARAANYRYQRHGHGAFQEDTWANLSHDYFPIHRLGAKIPNPRFNWQKAAQCYEPQEFRFKSDVWNLPSVLNGQVMSGRFDNPPAMSVRASQFA